MTLLNLFWRYTERKPYPTKETLTYHLCGCYVQIGKEMKPAYMPIKSQMNGENVVNIQSGILLSCLKKNKKEIITFVGKWTALESIIASKLTQIQKCKILIFSPILF